MWRLKLAMSKLKLSVREAREGLVDLSPGRAKFVAKPWAWTINVREKGPKEAMGSTTWFSKRSCDKAKHVSTASYPGLK